LPLVRSPPTKQFSEDVIVPPPLSVTALVLLEFTWTRQLVALIVIVAAKQPDGTLQGRAWRVGRDGVTPPM
jgi:hypothetical protein